MVHQLVIVGGGNMGAALIQGLLRAGTLGPSDLAVTETLEGRRAELATMFPGVTIGSEVAEATGAVIAVKPGDVSPAVAATAQRRRSPHPLHCGGRDDRAARRGGRR